jgi:hypothetical protein
MNGLICNTNQAKLAGSSELIQWIAARLDNQFEKPPIVKPPFDRQSAPGLPFTRFDEISASKAS